MNRKIKLLILLLLSMSVYFIYQSTKNNTYTITNIGDSLSLGINSYGIKEYSYVDYYKEYLSNIKNNIIVNNIKDKELSISNLLLTIKNKQSIKKDLYDTDILILTIGYNDLIYDISIEDNINELKLNNIIKKININYNELIKEIRKYYKEKIIVIGYPTSNKDNIYINKGIIRLNNILKNNKEIIYIDTYNLLSNRRKYFSNPNSNYPNKYAYMTISNKIIEKTLEK